MYLVEWGAYGVSALLPNRTAIISMFSIASASALITSTAGDIGVAVLAVLGLTIAAWGAFLVLRFGLRKIRGAVR